MVAGVRRKAILILLAVFLVGGLAGVMLEDVVDDLDWPWLHVGPDTDHRDRANDPMDDDAEEEFLEGLGLARDRLEAVDRVLDRREDRLEAYWAGKIPEIEALIDSTRTEIRDLLSPEQREAYDRWVARQRAPAPNP
jgi:hypothetical protein